MRRELRGFLQFEVIDMARQLTNMKHLSLRLEVIDKGVLESPTCSLNDMAYLSVEEALIQ